MSWDADLEVRCSQCGHLEEHCGEWNYTHNCNAMISAVVEDMGFTLQQPWLIAHLGRSWYEVLNTMSGHAGAVFLTEIVRRLEEESLRFEAMNPSNGWGSYETLLTVLRDMRDRSLQYSEATWHVSG